MYARNWSKSRVFFSDARGYWPIGTANERKRRNMDGCKHKRRRKLRSLLLRNSKHYHNSSEKQLTKRKGTNRPSQKVSSHRARERKRHSFLLLVNSHLFFHHLPSFPTPLSSPFPVPISYLPPLQQTMIQFHSLHSLHLPHRNTRTSFLPLRKSTSSPYISFPSPLLSSHSQNSQTAAPPPRNRHRSRKAPRSSLLVTSSQTIYPVRHTNRCTHPTSPPFRLIPSHPILPVSDSTRNLHPTPPLLRASVHPSILPDIGIRKRQRIHPALSCSFIHTSHNLHVTFPFQILHLTS